MNDASAKRSAEQAQYAAYWYEFSEAGWNRIARQTGEEYLSVKLEAPEIGVIFGNLAPAPGGDPAKKVILWNNPQ